MIDGNIDVLSLEGQIVDSISLEGDLLPIGPKGDKGDPGFSPVVTTSKVDKTTTIKFETATGNVFAYIQDGEDGQGSGDMMTDVYDKNKNGIVDNAEKVNNYTVLTDVPANAVFTDTIYDDTEVRGLINAKPDFSDIPTNVSDLTNDSGFIDNTVNNLTNYYLKSETYTKAEVNSLIAQIPGFNVLVVQTLPVSDIDTHTIYLVPKTGSGSDIYDEYLYINNTWELIGNTAVDLSNYYTKTETNTLLNAKANTSDLSTVATSGSYNDLSNKPTNVSTFTNDANYVSSNGSSTVSGEDTNITLNGTTYGMFKNITLKGNTSQTGTPTPSSPIPINNVSGQNEILIEGKNRLNVYNATYSQNGITITINNGEIIINGTATSTFQFTNLGIFNHIGSKNYRWTFIYESGSCTDYGGGAFFANSPTGNSNFGGGAGFRTNISRTADVYDKGTAKYYLYIAINNNSVFNNYKIKLQIVEGTTPDYNYEAYDGRTYTIDLDDIQLNKIGNYQDYIYNYGTKWYLHKEIGKVILNGSETINKGGTTNNQYFYANVLSNYIKPSNNDTLVQHYTNYFINKTPNQLSGGSVIGSAIRVDNTIGFAFGLNSEINTVDKCKIWLSSNNIVVNYLLATPTNTEITDTTLISQLNALYKAYTYKNQTNISQSNNDLPFILNVEAFTDTYNGRYENIINIMKVNGVWMSH